MKYDRGGKLSCTITRQPVTRGNRNVDVFNTLIEIWHFQLGVGIDFKRVGWDEVILSDTTLGTVLYVMF